jgi:type IV pilus assembly protein PilW
MQILYGVDRGTITAGVVDATKPDYIPDYYADAGNVVAADWAKIVSVRVTLLAVTLDNNLTDTPQTYTYNGVTTTPSDVCANNGVIVSTTLPCVSPAILVKDLRMRRVFSSTIAVRNRLP